jgi:DNA-binding MarR family transcriptional regulator
MQARSEKASRKSSAAGVAPSSECTCFAIRAAMRNVTQFYDDALSGSGLRITQYSILTRVFEHGGLTMNALADLLVMDRTTLTHNLRPLQQQGFLKLEVGDEDRRQRRVVLTPAGDRARLAARELWKVAQERFDAKVGADHARALRSALLAVAHTDLGLARD